LALTKQRVSAGLVIFAAGLAGGWMARGRFADRERGRSEAEEPENADEASPPAAAAGPRTLDDELRQVLSDAKAYTLAARVRNAANINGQCEVEVDTNIGWFRVGCGASETPSVGSMFELFGRLSPDGQIDGAPPLLRPAWLEPVGTIARLRGQ
jgi:hypothetical protein